MKVMYPLGYFFLCFFSDIVCSARIDQYYKLYNGLIKYQQFLQEKFKDKNIPSNIGVTAEQIEMSVKTTSEFATSCIMLSTLLKQSNKVAQGNIILQAIVAAYAMCSSFFEIIKYKQEQKKMVASMTYADMIMKFPQVVLIEYQLKIIKLLLEMHSSQNLAERAFARIQLVTMILPKPYEGISKKLAKKIYNNYFNRNGDLVFLQESDEEKIYKKILKTISISWQSLVLKSLQFSDDGSIFKKSEYKHVLESQYNQKILQMIEAARNHDFQKLYELHPNILEINLQELYDFLVNQIER